MLESQKSSLASSTELTGEALTNLCNMDPNFCTTYSTRNVGGGGGGGGSKIVFISLYQQSLK